MKLSPRQLCVARADPRNTATGHVTARPRQPQKMKRQLPDPLPQWRSQWGVKTLIEDRFFLSLFMDRCSWFTQLVFCLQCFRACIRGLHSSSYSVCSSFLRVFGVYIARLTLFAVPSCVYLGFTQLILLCFQFLRACIRGLHSQSQFAVPSCVYSRFTQFVLLFSVPSCVYSGFTQVILLCFQFLLRVFGVYISHLTLF